MTGNRIIELNAFDPEVYESVDLDRLVVFTAIELSRLGIELCLENIIVGAFRLFPKKFSLVGYPEYPDATRVEKALWRCKGANRRWIGGKTPHGYLITERTRRIASETESELSKGPPSKLRRAPSRGRRKESILKETTESSAYSKYSRGEGSTISEAEFCYLLQGTLDSTSETLRENLSSLLRFAEELTRPEITEFLKWLSKQGRFRRLLDGK